MYGIFFAAVLAAFWVLAKGYPVEVGFLSGMSFLLIWYSVQTVIAIIMVGFMTLIMKSGLEDAIAKVLNEKGGDPAGIKFVRPHPMRTMLKLVIRQAFLISGAYLLMTAGTGEIHFAEFNSGKLIFGTALLAAGILWRKGYKLLFGNK